MLVAFSSEPAISVASILFIASFTRPLSEEPDIKRSDAVSYTHLGINVDDVLKELIKGLKQVL